MSLDKRDIQYIEPETLQSWLVDGKNFRVIDVRDFDYNEGGHIKGAVNYPYRDFQTQLASIVDKELTQSSTFVFHCMRSQQRGPRCALRFKDYLTREYPNVEVSVYILRGGYLGWYLRKYESETEF